MTFLYVKPGESSPLYPKWDIWSEGYQVNEGRATAQLMAEGVRAETFQKACDLHFRNDDSYDSKRLTHWGCRLFNNERDARKGFG